MLSSLKSGSSVPFPAMFMLDVAENEFVIMFTLLM